MTQPSQRYENFLLNVRNNLLSQPKNLSPESLAYLSQATQSQIELLPGHLYCVFRLLLNVILICFALFPKSLHPHVLRVLRRLPGFSSVILYHEKIAAAAELELANSRRAP